MVKYRTFECCLKIFLIAESGHGKIAESLFMLLLACFRCLLIVTACSKCFLLVYGRLKKIMCPLGTSISLDVITLLNCSQTVFSSLVPDGRRFGNTPNF